MSRSPASRRNFLLGNSIFVVYEDDGRPNLRTELASRFELVHKAITDVGLLLFGVEEDVLSFKFCLGDRKSVV